MVVVDARGPGFGAARGKGDRRGLGVDRGIFHLSLDIFQLSVEQTLFLSDDN